jgi:hypothetical protein
MKRQPRRMWHAAAAAVTLSSLIGGGVAAASPARVSPARVSAAGVSWHKLKMLNGWTSYAAAGTGAPRWAVKNGTVYLSGSMYQASGSGSDFAVLPKAARPSRKLYINVFTDDFTLGWIVVEPDGHAFVGSLTYANAQGYTSLAAVSYPARSAATHKLTLINGWRSCQSCFGTGDPSYSVRGGVVYLSGSLQHPTGSREVFAVLPRSARPARPLRIGVYANGGSIGELKILPDGKVSASLGGTFLFTSLAGVSFPLGTRGTPLSLINGWKPQKTASHDGKPAYRVVGGVVYLSGAMRQPSGSGEQVAVLPRAARPAHTLYVTFYAAGTIGTLEILHNGEAYVQCSPQLAAQIFTSLAGISYPVSS